MIASEMLHHTKASSKLIGTWLDFCANMVETCANGGELCFNAKFVEVCDETFNILFFSWIKNR
jgi:hypothetical protein